MWCNSSRRVNGWQKAIAPKGGSKVCLPRKGGDLGSPEDGFDGMLLCILPYVIGIWRKSVYGNGLEYMYAHMHGVLIGTFHIRCTFFPLYYVRYR